MNLAELLWIDMENSLYTDRTVDLYTKILADYPNTGLAYLRGRESDVRRLAKLDSKIRFVKGAYNGSPSLAIKRKADITSSYSRLLTFWFSSARNDSFLTVVTHDSKLVDATNNTLGTAKASRSNSKC